MDDARKPITLSEKKEYEKLGEKLNQNVKQAKEKFNQDIPIGLDAQLSYAGVLLREAKYAAAAEQSYRTILVAHPDNTNVINGLGLVLFEQAKYQQAEELYNDALAKDEASFGPDYPKVARDLNNLAMLLKDTNRLDEAEPLMSRLLEILIKFTRQTGHEHPHLKDATNNYRILLMQMGYSEDEINTRLKNLK